MIAEEIYIEVCWRFFVTVIPLVEKLIRVCYYESEEYLYIGGNFAYSLSLALR